MINIHIVEKAEELTLLPSLDYIFDNVDFLSGLELAMCHGSIDSNAVTYITNYESLYKLAKDLEQIEVDDTAIVYGLTKETISSILINFKSVYPVFNRFRFSL